MKKKIKIKNAKVIETTVFKEGLAPKKEKRKWGFIDKAGNWVITPKFSYVKDFNEGLAAVELNNKWGFIDKTGEWVINPKYRWVNDFSNGLSRVIFINQKNYRKKEGYIDKTGKWVVLLPGGMWTGISKEGMVVITVRGKYGFIKKPDLQN